uniref:Uncharacterized protein n=1 Tax=Cacopsylla melanoneura TaxID=428564 RepID=A0A8D8QPB7_9HEMI
MMRMSVKPATATGTLASAASTWNCTSCLAVVPAACVCSADTSRPVVTVTTARRGTIGIRRGRLHIGRRVRHVIVILLAQRVKPATKPQGSARAKMVSLVSRVIGAPKDINRVGPPSPLALKYPELST